MAAEPVYIKAIMQACHETIQAGKEQKIPLFTHEGRRASPTFQWCGVRSRFVGFGAAMWGSEVSFANNGVPRYISL